MKKYKTRINLNNSCLLIDCFPYSMRQHIYNLMYDLTCYNIHVVAESFESAKKAIFNIPKKEMYKLLFEEDPILHNREEQKYQKHTALEALNRHIKDGNPNSRNRCRTVHDYFTCLTDFDLLSNCFYAKRDLELNLLDEVEHNTEIDNGEKYNKETIREIKMFRYENIKDLDEQINKFIRGNQDKSIEIINIQYQITQPQNGVLLSSDTQSHTTSNFFKTNSRTLNHTNYSYSKGTKEYHNALVDYSYILKERLIFADSDVN